MIPHIRPTSLLVVALGLAACGSTPAAAPSTPAANPVSASAASAASAATSGKPAASASGKPAASSQTSGLIKVAMANSSTSGDSIPVWVAAEAGIFQKNGLEVDQQLISGAAASMATLISGKVQFGNLGGSAVLTAAAAGADVVMLGSDSPVMPYKFYVPPDIKTAADLKGKKVDLGTIGSAVDVATKLGVKQLGLDPDKDVVYTTTGSHPAATAALIAGAIQGRMDNPPGSVELDAKGFNVLIDLASQKIPAANSTISVARGYLNQNHEIVQKYIDSLVQGTARARADKAFTVKTLEKYYKSDDQHAMEVAYDFWMGEVIPPLPFVKPDQLTVTKEDLAKTTPAVQNLDITKLIDSSFVQSAADRGLDRSSS